MDLPFTVLPPPRAAQPAVGLLTAPPAGTPAIAKVTPVPTYTGDVAPGGPSAVRLLPDVVLRKTSVSSMDNNVYLLTDRATGRQLLIDAADDAPRLLALVSEGVPDGGQGLDLVVTTHRHWDHHRALAAVLDAAGARSAAGRDDAAHLPVAPDVVLDHGDTVTVGATTLDVVQLRGHTPGSIALILRAGDGSTHAFTGDSLFPGGVGNTDKDPQRFAQLLADVEERLFGVLPDDTWVYPGHGKDTTLGAERPSLVTWRKRGW
jgi:glyoxylase-like metal-dependent hydrolase (beta-lactamase superfamily II)